MGVNRIGMERLMLIRLIPNFVVRFLGSRNPNGSGIWRCTCCEFDDGCDDDCREAARKCHVHGVSLPVAVLRG